MLAAQAADALDAPMARDEISPPDDGDSGDGDAEDDDGDGSSGDSGDSFDRDGIGSDSSDSDGSGTPQSSAPLRPSHSRARIGIAPTTSTPPPSDLERADALADTAMLGETEAVAAAERAIEIASRVRTSTTDDGATARHAAKRKKRGKLSTALTLICCHVWLFSLVVLTLFVTAWDGYTVIGP